MDGAICRSCQESVMVAGAYSTKSQHWEGPCPSPRGWLHDTGAFTLAYMCLEWWNAQRFFPRSHQVGSGDSEESSIHSHRPGAAGCGRVMGWKPFVLGTVDCNHHLRQGLQIGFSTNCNWMWVTSDVVAPTVLVPDLRELPPGFHGTCKDDAVVCALRTSTMC